MQDKALKLYASSDMMMHFWGVHSVACSNRRKLLGVEVSAGRPSGTKTKKELEILIKEISMNVSSINDIDGFIKTAEATGLGLNKIWQIYNKYKSGTLFDNECVVKDTIAL